MLVSRFELEVVEVWAPCVYPFAIPANGRCEKTCASADPPYEGSAPLFELHSIKMEERVGLEPTPHSSRGLSRTILQTVCFNHSQTYPWLKWRRGWDSNPRPTHRGVCFSRALHTAIVNLSIIGRSHWCCPSYLFRERFYRPPCLLIH